jgi:succinate dehydrogenase / fumarate reductase, cytochrome b subunit
MILTGLVIFFYLAYHLLHFTLGGVHGEYFHLKDNLGRHDVYSMVVLSFQQPLISVVYILAMFFMAVHLSHGLPSLFQSLGANSPRFENGFKRAGISVAVLLFLGFSSIPAAILAGLVKLP